MLKKLPVFMLALVLALSLTTAFAWNCPSCGGGNEGKFCTECGTKKPENICPECGTNFGEKSYAFCVECGAKLGATAATSTPAPAVPVFTKVYDDISGAVLLEWESDGKSPYTVRCFRRFTDDPQADLANPLALGGKAYQETSGRIILIDIAPGTQYWLGLFDSQGNGNYVPFESAAVTEDFPSSDTLSIEPSAVFKIRENGEDTRAKSVSLKDIADPGKSIGLFLRLEYKNNTPDTFTPFVRIVIEAPNGSKDVPISGTMSFKAQTEDVAGVSFASLDEFFGKLESAWGKVPAGAYKMRIYLNRVYLTGFSFQVTEDNATPTPKPTATPSPERPSLGTFTTNDNGTLTITWAGGTPPYSVRYHVKRSEDYNADLEAENTLGRFLAESDLNETEFTFKQLVPGQAYWISVFDANGKGVYRAHTPAAVQPFTDFPTRLTAAPYARQGESLSKLKALPLSVAGQDDGVSHGMSLYLHYDNPGQPVDHLVQLALTLPNGSMLIDKSFVHTFDQGEDRSAFWNFYSLENYLNIMRLKLGTVPEGDLKLDMYLDGKLAGTTLLPMTNTKPLTILQVVQDESGMPTLSWEGGVAPYEVCYTVKRSEDYEADRNAKNAVSLWQSRDNLTESSDTLEYLVPGQAYWLRVKDAEGAQAVYAYQPAAVQPFTAFETAITAFARSKAGEETTDLDYLPIDDIGKDDGVSHGIYLGLEYSNPDVPEQSYFIQPVVTMPNGTMAVLRPHTGALQQAQDRSYYWNFFDLEWFTNLMISKFGALAEGDLKVDFYLNGQLAGSALVPMKSSKPLVITGIAPQGDGKWLLTWEDNGCGPYIIRYHERWSADRSADLNDPRTPTQWYEEPEAGATSQLLSYLVPGQNYWVILEDAMGTQTAVTAVAPLMRDSGLPLTFDFRPRRDENGRYTDLTEFSAAELTREHSCSYGLYLEIFYQNPPQKEQKLVQVVMTLPNGARFAIDSFLFNLFPDGSTYWDCYGLDWAFSMANKFLSGNLEGEYALDFYIEGQHAGQFTFTVGK